MIKATVRFTFCILFLTISSFKVKGQPVYENNIDSVKSILRYCEDSLYSNSERVGIMCEKLKNKIIQVKETHTVANAYRIIANYYNKVSNYDSASFYYQKALHEVEEDTDMQSIGIRGLTLLNYGLMFHYNGDFNTAMNLYMESRDYLTKSNDQESLVNVNSKISDVYIKFRQFDKAREYTLAAFKKAEEIGNEKLLGKIYIDYANLCTNDSLYEEAEIYYEKAFQIGKKYSIYPVLINYYYNKGFNCSERNDFINALSYYQKSLEVSKKSGSKFDEYDALYKVGLMYYYMENHEKGEKILQEALIHAKDIKSKVLERNIYDALLFLEADRKNYEKAFDYQFKFVDLLYENFTEQNQQQVNFLNAKYQAELRENRIVQLENENQIHELKLKQRRNFVFVLILVLIVLISFTIILIINYNHKRKLTRKNEELKDQKIKELEKDKQLVAINSVLQGEESERHRLARDLHDGLGGLLSGVKMSLTSVKGNVVLSEESVLQFDKALGLLDNSITELRHVAHNMMPEALIKFGLKDAVNDFCSKIKITTGIDIQFQYFGENKRLDNTLELAIYRIIQELINNAVKHGNSNFIMVQIIHEHERFHLTVQDNGIGFDVSKLTEFNGAGLRNVKNRVDVHNGRIDINSNINEGTEISIEFKINT